MVGRPPDSEAGNRCASDCRLSKHATCSFHNVLQAFTMKRRRSRIGQLLMLLAEVFSFHVVSDRPLSSRWIAACVYIPERTVAVEGTEDLPSCRDLPPNAPATGRTSSLRHLQRRSTMLKLKRAYEPVTKGRRRALPRRASVASRSFESEAAPRCMAQGRRTNYRPQTVVQSRPGEVVAVSCAGPFESSTRVRVVAADPLSSQRPHRDARIQLP